MNVYDKMRKIEGIRSTEDHLNMIAENIGILGDDMVLRFMNPKARKELSEGFNRSLDEAREHIIAARWAIVDALKNK